MSVSSRVGVIVLDHGRPADAERAALSARDSSLDVRVLVVENGTGPEAPAHGHLRLSQNRGFAGGMNAGIEKLSCEGCTRFLLLNNDAVLDAGCLRLLTAALDHSPMAAVGPVILRQGDGRIESRGVHVDLRSGRVRLLGHGEEPPGAGGLVPVEALSGAVMLLSRAAVDRVGVLDEEYFFSFEDLDWCVRARRAGLGLAVVADARARHVGAQTLGPGSPERLYYAARNHVRLAEKLLPLPRSAGWLRRGAILGLNLGFALRQRDVPRPAAARAVWRGFRDACRGQFGPRT